MKTIKILLILLATLTLAASYAKTNKQSQQIIKGHIKGLDNNKIILIDDRSYPIDTIQASAGEFTFSHNLDINDPGLYGLFLPQLSNKSGGVKINKTFFLVDHNLIEVKGEIITENLKNIEVLGSPLTTEYNELEANFPASIALKKYEKPYNEAFQNYNYKEKSTENLKKLKYYGNIIDSLFELKRQNIIDAIPGNHESIALAALFYYNFRSESMTFLETNLAKFSPKIKNSRFLDLVQKQINLKKGVSIGSKAPQFTLPNQKNEEIKLSKFIGKYVLIDFWASWCGPCRKEIPNLKKVYQEFKSQNLEIISISTDSDADSWRKAMEKEQMPWLQLLSTKEVVSQYNVVGIPFLILLDPEGTILIKGHFPGEKLWLELEKSGLKKSK